MRLNPFFEFGEIHVLEHDLRARLSARLGLGTAGRARNGSARVRVSNGGEGSTMTMTRDKEAIICTMRREDGERRGKAEDESH